MKSVKHVLMGAALSGVAMVVVAALIPFLRWVEKATSAWLGV